MPITPEICPHCGEAIGGQKIYSERNLLLEVVGLAYRKHHLMDDSIAWEELSDQLHDVLCNVMGDELYQKWLKEVCK